MNPSAFVPMTDGVVVLRASRTDDVPALLAGRDADFMRWLGPGVDEPAPVACIVVDTEVVGWVDHDEAPAWLRPGEVNVGYNVFPAHRGRGYASRAVQLLLHHLAVRSGHRTATLAIDPDNDRSLALAARLRFTPSGLVDGSRYFKRPVPPTTLTDGEVTIRPPRPDDLHGDPEVGDDEQPHGLWLPGPRKAWQAMAPSEPRAHAPRGPAADHAAFGTGPTWRFAVDTAEAPSVASVDCDLAGDHVPAGEADISYSCHPDHLGRGHMSRAVRLVTRFLRDSTGARRAHLLVDAENVASLRVAAAVGATPVARWVDGRGRTMVRHHLDLTSA